MIQSPAKTNLLTADSISVQFVPHHDIHIIDNVKTNLIVINLIASCTQPCQLSCSQFDASKTICACVNFSTKVELQAGIFLLLMHFRWLLQLSKYY